MRTTKRVKPQGHGPVINLTVSINADELRDISRHLVARRIFVTAGMDEEQTMDAFLLRVNEAAVKLLKGSP